jgi:hypothetical protein
VEPNRVLTERVATLPYFDPDHYESTHHECDMLTIKRRWRLRPAGVFGWLWKFVPSFPDDSEPGCAILRGYEVVAMQEDYIECSELSGKTIQTLRIHKDTGDGTDVQIELTDGTTFSCCLSNQPAVKESLYRGGAGTPETLQSYEI